MTELNLKNSVRAAIKKHYPDAFIWKIHDGFTAGIPDFLIIVRGMHIFIELKITRGIVSPIQEYTIAKIKTAGGRAHVCRSVDEVLEVIRLALVAENKDLVTAV